MDDVARDVARRQVRKTKKMEKSVKAPAKKNFAFFPALIRKSILPTFVSYRSKPAA